ncbi:MAG: hypothetical protein ACO2PN_25365, partial [Pyrobaculum sp.]
WVFAFTWAQAAASAALSLAVGLALVPAYVRFPWVNAPFFSGQTRGALGSRKPKASGIGALASWGARPPPLHAPRSGWALGSARGG